MADKTTDPHDDKVRTVPLPTDDGAGERVIAQENQSPEVAMGGGEWPSTDAPPTGPAPGTGQEPSETEPERRPGGTLDGPPPGSGTNPGLQQDGRSAGDRGPARVGDTGLPGGEGAGFAPVKDALEADPVAAGSSSVPEEDDEGQGTAGTRFS